MVDTLEGPGVVESKCPACARPGWARELLPNRKLEALVGHLLADRQAGAHRSPSREPAAGCLPVPCEY